MYPGMVSHAALLPRLICCWALFGGCASAEPVPTSASTGGSVGQLRLLWVGWGRAERFVDGTWRRAAEQDYEFSVRQDRFSFHWESIKTMHRRHPAYDGSAGPRNQAHFFLVKYRDGQQMAVQSTIESSFGPGHGTSDGEFRRCEFTLLPERSSFAPYNRIRIAQQYDYEEGRLRETVYLFDSTQNRERPFFRVQEEATIFAAARLPAAPTRWRNR